MKRFRLAVALALVAGALVLPASAASAKPELCDFVENTVCDRLP